MCIRKISGFVLMWGGTRSSLLRSQIFYVYRPRLPLFRYVPIVRRFELGAPLFAGLSILSSIGRSLALSQNVSWVYAMDVPLPISSNTDIPFSERYIHIGFLPISTYIGSNMDVHPRAHHPVDLLHVQVLLHRPHAPPSGSLAPVTSSSTPTASTVTHCPPLAWCPPPG